MFVRYFVPAVEMCPMQIMVCFRSSFCIKGVGRKFLNKIIIRKIIVTYFECLPCREAWILTQRRKGTDVRSHSQAVGSWVQTTPSAGFTPVVFLLSH